MDLFEICLEPSPTFKRKTLCFVSDWRTGAALSKYQDADGNVIALDRNGDQIASWESGTDQRNDL